MTDKNSFNKVTFQNRNDIGLVDFFEDPHTTIKQNLNEKHQNHIPNITEIEARKALNSFLCQHLCYGKEIIKDIKFIEIKSFIRYRYILETFTESRSTKYKFVPYNHEVIANTGTQFLPWDILILPETVFYDHKQIIEVPNSARVDSCKKCMGVGHLNCLGCLGRTSSECLSCIKGYKNNKNGPELCLSCHGRGKIQCANCNGSGIITCNECNSSGLLKYYLELEVKFENHVEDFIRKIEDVPDDLLRKCAMKSLLIEQNFKVNPLKFHFDQEVNQTSLRLINLHASKFSQCRILMQKHEVYAIPIAICSYIYNEKPYSFYVYGLESMVYCTDYPKKCFCCTIM